ncbi:MULTISPECIES: mechanosensitive ion channel domain-containing protein [Gammaproteobacteria]|uniref:Small-conductance mechanosensitive channel n=1 Tax=Xanthomonas boreopolis TaxID=86183 RepID=A0A919F5E1_9XANT|nr:mechanosensitive ion channel domain-containing protein [Pseudomonas sp. Hp2]GHH46659.1 membrane protein [[Pseudomonas] boreopolis]
MHLHLPQPPTWVAAWLDIVVPVAEVLAILGLAWLLVRILVHALRLVGRRYELPPALVIGARRIVATFLYAAALLLVLERLGVSVSVLWTAITGFAAVGAVAFFAAWSVLSNIFCSFLIFATKPFRLHDRIELIDSADKPGVCGRVIDINFIYTTLQDQRQETQGSTLQIPNSLFFQRMTRRWYDA